MAWDNWQLLVRIDLASHHHCSQFQVCWTLIWWLQMVSFHIEAPPIPCDSILQMNRQQNLIWSTTLYHWSACYPTQYRQTVETMVMCVVLLWWKRLLKQQFVFFNELYILWDTLSRHMHSASHTEDVHNNLLQTETNLRSQQAHLVSL